MFLKFCTELHCGLWSTIVFSNSHSTNQPISRLHFALSSGLPPLSLSPADLITSSRAQPPSVVPAPSAATCSSTPSGSSNGGCLLLRLPVVGAKPRLPGSVLAVRLLRRRRRLGSAPDIVFVVGTLVHLRTQRRGGMRDGRAGGDTAVDL